MLIYYYVVMAQCQHLRPQDALRDRGAPRKTNPSWLQSKGRTFKNIRLSIRQLIGQRLWTTL